MKFLENSSLNLYRNDQVFVVVKCFYEDSKSKNEFSLLVYYIRNYEDKWEISQTIFIQSGSVKIVKK